MKEINRSRKKKNRLLIKGISNIHLKSLREKLTFSKLQFPE